MKFNSLKFEISILFMLIMGIVLVIITGVFYVIIANTLYTDLDNELKMKAQGVGQTIRAYVDARGEGEDTLKYALDKTIAQRGNTQKKWWFMGFERRWYKQLEELDLAQEFINFAQPDGTSIMSTPGMDLRLLEKLAPEVRAFQGSEVVYRNLDIDQKRFRVITMPFPYKSEELYYIQVVTSPKPITLLLQNWLHSIIFSIPFILVLMGFVGHVLAARIIAPVQRITRIAQKITYEDLSERVDATSFHREMNSLIDAFNDMILRLEKSFKHIEEFSSHVAHELKTPLTIIRGETELALMEDRSIDEYKDAMRVSLEETDKMLKIIEDLFLLTKIDYQPEAFRFSRISFNEFIKEVYLQAKMLAKPKKIDIHLDLGEDDPLFVKADQVHLRRLFFNLIDNSLKFTPAGEDIYIEVSRVVNKMVVSVRDTGIGIPKKELPRVFERFFRINSQKVGSGLGLSIAQSIARIHGGKIHVQSQVKKGTTFSVVLPLCA